MISPPQLAVDSILPALARATEARGGRLLIVGGWIRDQLRGQDSKDLDVEIFGLLPEAIDALLDSFGSIGRVGRHFPIWRLRHQPLDIGYPRAGSLDFDPSRPDSIDAAFRAAARHRDLSINAIGWDPLTDRWLDPWRGIADLRASRLVAVDPETFGSDPLRGLRVARLHAQIGAEVETSTLELCRALDLSTLPAERIKGELRRILTEPDRPSEAFKFLDRSGQLEIFTPLAALRGVSQDPRWHPEGDVFVHTLMVVDQARQIGRPLEAGAAETLQWAALSHDLGKPATTTQERGRIRSIGHERVGATRTREWLEELRVSQAMLRAVEVLVAHHLAPAQFASQGAGGRAYRRLARKLAIGRMTVVELERLARADHLGRSTEAARAGRFPEGQIFLDAAAAHSVESGVRPDVVSAKRLMDHGMTPGPVLGRALARAREIQDEHGASDPERILRQVLSEFEPPS